MFGNSLPKRSETILFVEDKQLVLNAILRILEPEPYCVLVSQTPKAALQIGSRHDYHIDLLLTDIVLPGLFGWELAELMKLDYPQLRVLYIAGGCENDIQELGHASDLILRKPFRSHDLLRAVRKALDEHFVKMGLQGCNHAGDSLAGSSRREVCLSRSSPKHIGSVVDPYALKIRPEGTEYSLTENAPPPYHAEPKHPEGASDTEEMKAFPKAGMVEAVTMKARTAIVRPGTSRRRRQTVGSGQDSLPNEDGSIMAENDESLLKKAGEQLAQVGVEASRLITAAAHAVEDAVTDVKRLAKRSRYAAEDLADDTAHRIKRDPLGSVAVGFAVGLGVGMLTGWLVTRGTKR